MVTLDLHPAIALLGVLAAVYLVHLSWRRP